jgi:hypothetical protein
MVRIGLVWVFFFALVFIVDSFSPVIGGDKMEYGRAPRRFRRQQLRQPAEPRVAIRHSGRGTLSAASVGSSCHMLGGLNYDYGLAS